MRISNRLARLAREGRPAVGMWINFCDPGVAQIAALTGYDWIAIDNEHNPLTETQVQGLIHAVEGADVQTVVRVRANREEHVKWVLDAGAGGVIIPRISSIADARHAVDICKYQPLGNRGYSPLRATGFWAQREEYMSRANRDVLLICQIEHHDAVDDIDAICRIEGVDGILLGLADLAQSMGFLTDPGCAEVRAARDRVIETANRHGKPWGLPTACIEDFQDCVERGGTLMTLSSDSRILMNRAAELARRAKEITAATDRPSAK